MKNRIRRWRKAFGERRSRQPPIQNQPSLAPLCRQQELNATLDRSRSKTLFEALDKYREDFPGLMSMLDLEQLRIYAESQHPIDFTTGHESVGQRVLTSLLNMEELKRIQQLVQTEVPPFYEIDELELKTCIEWLKAVIPRLNSKQDSEFFHQYHRPQIAWLEAPSTDSVLSYYFSSIPKSPSEAIMPWMEEIDPKSVKIDGSSEDFYYGTPSIPAGDLERQRGQHERTSAN